MALTYRLHPFPGLLLLEWVGTPDVPSLNALEQELDRVLAAPPPPAILTVIREHSVAPGSEARDRLNEVFSTRLPRFAWHGLVIEGRGLAAETKRLFTRAALVLMGQRSPIFDSVESALASAAAPAAQREAVLATLRAGR